MLGALRKRVSRLRDLVSRERPIVHALVRRELQQKKLKTCVVCHDDESLVSFVVESCHACVDCDAKWRSMGGSSCPGCRRSYVRSPDVRHALVFRSYSAFKRRVQCAFNLVREYDEFVDLRFYEEFLRRKTRQARIDLLIDLLIVMTLSWSVYIITSTLWCVIHGGPARSDVRMGERLLST
jgi:hypothetical protein